MDEDPDSTQTLDLNTAPTLASKAKLLNQVPTRDTQPIHSPDDDTVAIGESVRPIKFEGLVDEAPPSTEDQANKF